VFFYQLLLAKTDAMNWQPLDINLTTFLVILRALQICALAAPVERRGFVPSYVELYSSGPRTGKEKSYMETLRQELNNSRSVHLPCFLDESMEPLCCSPGTTPPAHCFDEIYTRIECCSAGTALLAPIALPDNHGMRLPDSLSLVLGKKRRKPLHPSYSAEQSSFEKMHKKVSVISREHFLGFDIVLADFKRSQKKAVLLREVHERDPYGLRSLEHLKRRRHNATFVDIGAGIGEVSILLAKMYPRSRIVAVEPEPEKFRYLLWNLKLNGLTDRVWPINAGLGRDGCTGARYLAESASWYAPEALSARGPCISLSELFAQFGLETVQLMKIDCEGCEYEALASAAAQGLVTRRVENLAGETHNSCFGCDRRPKPAVVQRILKLLCWKRLQQRERNYNVLCTEALAASPRIPLQRFGGREVMRFPDVPSRGYG